jgi:hypothetical protein
VPACNFGLTPGLCPALDQIAGLDPQVPEGPILSTLVFSADAAGIAEFSVAPFVSPGFFDLLTADAPTVVIGHDIVIVPETAGLVGLGLLGLSPRRRVR